MGTHEHFHVTRDIISDTISLSGAGNTAVFSKTFTVDPGWNPANLQAVVFVQRAADKEVLQASCTYPKPDYSVRAIVPFSRMSMGPSSGTHSTPHLTIANTGFADTFTINLLVDEAPPSWMANYCDGGGTCHVGEWSFDLGVDGSIEFYANVLPDSPGYMRCHFEITSPNLTTPLVIPLTYTTNDAGVLIIDDAGAEDYENYYTAALDTLGLTYGMWDRSFTDSELTPEVLQSYRLLIWQVGLSYPTLDATDRDFLTDHLDNGGSLFLTGQDRRSTTHRTGPTCSGPRLSGCEVAACSPTASSPATPRCGARRCRSPSALTRPSTPPLRRGRFVVRRPMG